MSPRTEKQYEQIREERKQQIMDVALELIAKEGFSKVSIAKIAQKAKISKGLLYNYFESKDALIKCIIDSGLNEILQFFDPNKDGILTEEEFHYFIDGTLDIMQDNLKFWKLYFGMMFQPEVYKVFENKIMEVFQSFAEPAIVFFTKKGFKDPMAELRFLGAVLDGVGMNYVMDPRHFPLEAIREKLHKMYQ